ncbi:MAG: hypothetical protein IK072_05365 [Clostridia bacterium]|nr:hypothetical protein [Clostridia bacterium]
MGVYGSPEIYPNENEESIDSAKWEKNLIYCYKCGTKYSKKFKRCPNCKTRKPKMFYNRWWFWLFVLLFAIIIFSNSDTSTTPQSNISDNSKESNIQVQPEETEEEYKAKCINVQYNDLARNPNNYIGQYGVFTGKVIQVQEAGRYITLRVDVTKGQYGIWDDTVYVDYRRIDNNESRILEDDIITMYGQIKGIKTYETVLGNTISIPHLEAKYIDIN